MKWTTRRSFLRQSLATSLALSLPRPAWSGADLTIEPTPSDAVRLGIIGLGGLNVVGGVGGRGRQLIAQLRKIPTARMVALCDVDPSVLHHELQPLKDQGEQIVAYGDLRQVFDDKNVDAVVIATPNHWHGLATIWACQAGKDVYVEKPFSHNIWEGRQMLAAARKHKRILQVGTQSRSSSVLREAFEYLRSGQLGSVRYAHALVYRPREGLGKVSVPSPIPQGLDYDLWCGPSPKDPIMRRQLHYEWHWFWATGNGEAGNNGIHVIDICRWALGQPQAAPRAMSIGGRFGFNDGGETPNTQVILLDYKPAPILCEIRNVRVAPGTDSGGKFRQRNGGVVIDCDGGYLAGDANGVTVFDTQGVPNKEFKTSPDSMDPEEAHLTNFLDAVRSRNTGELAAEAAEGHSSTTCCHLANISHRIGKESSPEAIRELIRSDRELLDAFVRCREHLRANGVDLGATPAVLGPWVTFDPGQDRFLGDFATQANELSRREYRKPFVVPEIGKS